MPDAYKYCREDIRVYVYYMYLFVYLCIVWVTLKLWGGLDREL